VGRRVARLTLDQLEELPGGCASCLFWQLPPVRRQGVCGHEEEEKATWLSGVLRDWGSCGRVVYVDDVLAGHTLYAPSVYFPGADGFPTAPVSNDAVLLSTIQVAPAFRGQGLGRVLVQAMAKDLLQRDIRAVEAFGDTRGQHGQHLVRLGIDGQCVLPADFLLAVGFRTHRAHATYPRMRMDLRTTLTWREEFEVALDRLLSGIWGRQPRPVPGGTPRAPRQATPARRPR
jgi:GNAT superfamily N-acetyltransferase